MAYQLTGRTGAYKGISWGISETPLVLGRDITCDIPVSDPIVSRRHCEIALVNGAPQVTDLGSSNATFVNAEPVKQARLKTGDEIAVGGLIFFVTELRETERETAGAVEKQEATHSLRIGEPTFLAEDGESLFARGRPRTAEDLADLFNLGRALSQAGTTGKLIAIVMDRIEARFNPELRWMVLMHGADEGFSLYPPEEGPAFSANRSLQEIVRRAIQEPKGILLPERWVREGQTGIRTSMVAPIALGTEPVGAIVLQADTPKRIYDESDLEALLAIAHTAAPYLKAAERLEQLERENLRLIAGAPNAGPIIGTGRAISRVRAAARNCARSDLNVLIMGETGTGKELVARMIHELSDRADRSLTIVNCAAIPDELFESELFGHEKGAYTGAHADKVGLFEDSDGGTLFLDEVGDLSLHNQARLLRAIETGTFRRLGGRTDIHVNVRVISATNKQLGSEVAAGRFRRDLYHRLNAFEIHIPPLRERRADIPMLAEHFLGLARARFRSAVEGFDPAAMKVIQEHAWPGNVRELRNVIERAVVVARGPRIRPEDLVIGAGPEAEQAPLPSMEEMEKRHILQAIQICGGNMSAAADLLKIGRSTLYRKVAEYGISDEKSG